MSAAIASRDRDLCQNAKETQKPVQTQMYELTLRQPHTINPATVWEP